MSRSLWIVKNVVAGMCLPDVPILNLLRCPESGGVMNEQCYVCQNGWNGVFSLSRTFCEDHLVEAYRGMTTWGLATVGLPPAEQQPNLRAHQFERPMFGDGREYV